MEIRFNNNQNPSDRPRRPAKGADRLMRIPRTTRRVLMIIAAVLALALVITMIALPISCAVRNSKSSSGQSQSAEANNGGKFEELAVTEPATKASSYKIDGIPLIKQDYYKAGCESYACVMLLQGLGYDIDMEGFIDNYLILREFYYGDDGNMYGPDMDAAYAGDIFHGAGINCPAMAKSMNLYLKTQKKGQTAYPFKGKTLQQLSDEYVSNGIPVMVWVTTYMDESYEKLSWVIDYVDENCERQVGDTMVWRQNEHCMVLIGYTDTEYIFNDSVAGEVVKHPKELCETRFQEIGQQSVVVY